VVKNQTAISIWASFLKKHWPTYSLGAASVLLTDACQVIGTLTLGWVLDLFTGEQALPVFFQSDNEQTSFWLLFGVLALSRVLLTLGRMGWRITLGRRTHVASAMLRGWIWERARFFKNDDLQKKWTKGLLMNASNSDVNAARFIFGFTLVALVDVLFLGIFTLWAMLSISYSLTLLSLAGLIFIPFVVKRLTDSEMKRYQSAQNSLSDFNDLSSQVVSTIRLQRMTQTGDFWEKRLLDSAESYRKERLSAVKTSLLFIPTMGAGSILSYIVLFGIGIGYVLNGSMTIGDFVAMQGLIFLLQNPLMELGYIISDGKKGQTSLERLNKIYTENIEQSLVSSGVNVSHVENVLTLKNVSFSYPEQDQLNPLICDMGLELKKGERLGLLGPIGSGKSTLIYIMAGLVRGHQGAVLFHERNFDDYTHIELRSLIGVVGQRPFLFAASVRENLEMDKDLSDEQCWHYLELAGLKSDIEQLDHGLETQLGEWGLNLSGGQKQRLTLARALARRPSLLFLDDCLSAVDTVTEEKILKSLDRELKGTTLVWVAHRSSTLKYCDRLVDFGSLKAERPSPSPIIASNYSPEVSSEKI
jgi:ATP-binding cassette subfamily B protein